MKKGQVQKSANNGESRSGSGRRLAAVIVLLLLIGIFWFVVTDNPQISQIRDNMLSHLSGGDAEDPDAETGDSGSSDTGSGTDSGVSGSGTSGNVATLNTNDLPEYNGEHYVAVNNNIPVFPDDVYERAGYTTEGQIGSSSANSSLSYRSTYP